MTFHWPPLAPAETDPCLVELRQFLKPVMRIDPLMYANWLHANLMRLSLEFVLSKREDVEIWLKERFCAERGIPTLEQPSSVAPPTCTSPQGRPTRGSDTGRDS